MKKVFTFLNAILISQAAVADYSSSVDSKGCWDAKDSYGNSCIYRASGELKNGQAIVKYGNKCDHRIYAKLCNERNNGSWDCGSDGIGAGGYKSWNTYDASGSTYSIAIGSTKSSYDWVCTDHVSNWHDK